MQLFIIENMKGNMLVIYLWPSIGCTSNYVVTYKRCSRLLHHLAFRHLVRTNTSCRNRLIYNHGNQNIPHYQHNMDAQHMYGYPYGYMPDLYQGGYPSDQLQCPWSQSSFIPGPIGNVVVMWHCLLTVCDRLHVLFNRVLILFHYLLILFHQYIMVTRVK
jgi:hypothetical protein